MDEFSNGQWSQSQSSSACFMVLDSQEEDPGLPTKGHGHNLFHSLVALKTLRPENPASQSSGLNKPKTQQGRQHQVAGEEGGNHGKSQGSSDDAPAGQEDPGQGAGEGREGQGEGAEAGGGGRGFGGGGGGDRRRGDDPEQAGDEEEEEEEHEDSSPPSSDGSAPGLVPPSTSTTTPPRDLPRHVEHQQPAGRARDMFESEEEQPHPAVLVTDTASACSDTDGHPQALLPGLAVPDSESEGGISDAATAVLSDTEVAGFSVRPRAVGPSSTFLSPARSRGSSAFGSPRGMDISSVMSVSSLSSFSSSSSSDERGRPGQWTSRGKKRAPSKRGDQELKRTKQDASSSDTSGHKTSDTSGDKEHDVSDEVSPSQKDLFEEDPGMEGDQKPSGTRGQEVGDEDDPVATPAEVVGSLRFSGQPSSAPEALHKGMLQTSQPFGEVPHLVPSSPSTVEPVTVPASQESVVEVLDSQEEAEVTMKRPQSIESSTGWESKKPHSPAPRKGSDGSSSQEKSGPPSRQSSRSSSSSGSLRPSSVTFQQWQPSASMTISTPEESLRSVTTSDQQEVLGSETRRVPERVPPGESSQSEKEDSLHLLMAATGQTGDSDDLSIQNQSRDSDVMITGEDSGLDQEEEFKSALGDQLVEGAEEPEGSQELSLHFSPSQPPEDGSQFTFGVSDLVSRLETQVAEGENLVGLGEEGITAREARSSQKKSHEREEERSQGEFHLNLPDSSSMSRSDVEGVPAGVLENLSRIAAESEKGHESQSQKIKSGSVKRKKSHSQSREEVESCEKEPELKRERSVDQMPSLTLDMIDTQTQEASEESIPLFRLEPPTLEAQVSGEGEENQDISLFKKTREARAKKAVAPTGSSSESDDPFAFSGSRELKKQGSFQKLQEKKRSKLQQLRESQGKGGAPGLTPVSEITQTASEQPEMEGDETLGEEEIVLPSQDVMQEDSDIIPRKKGAKRYLYEEDSEPLDKTQRERSTCIDTAKQTEVEQRISLGPDDTFEGDSSGKEQEFTAIREKVHQEKVVSDEKSKSSQATPAKSGEGEPSAQGSQRGGRTSQSTSKHSRHKHGRPNPQSSQKSKGRSSSREHDESQKQSKTQSDVTAGSGKKQSSRTKSSTRQISSSAPTSGNRTKSNPNPRDQKKAERSSSQHAVVSEGAAGSPSRHVLPKDPFEYRESQTQRDRQSLEQVKNLAGEARQHSSLSQVGSGSSTSFSSRTVEYTVVYREVTVFREEYSGGRFLPTKVVGERREVISRQMDVVEEEVVSSVSPSRTHGSMTSGDLGDISSSLSRSTGSKSPRDGLSSSSLHTTAGSLSKTSSSSSLTRGHTFHSPTSPPKSGEHTSSSLPSVNSDTFHPEATSTMAEPPEDSHPVDQAAGNVSRAKTKIIIQPDTRESTSSTSLKQSEPLISSSSVSKSEVGKQESSKTTSKSTSSSYKPSASLFSTSSDISLGEHDQDVFSKPVAPAKKSRSRHRSGPESLPTLEQELSDESIGMIPPTDPGNQAKFMRPTAHVTGNSGSEIDPNIAEETIKPSKGKGKGKSSIIKKDSRRGRKKATLVADEHGKPAKLSGLKRGKETIPVILGEEQEEGHHISPEIPLVAPVSSTPSQSTAGLASMILDSDTPVFAKWKDSHYYPGHISKKEKSGKYSVIFEDGTRRQAKTEDIIVCDLLKKDQEVYAEYEADGCFYPATIIEAINTAEFRGYVVEFPDGDKERVKRGKVMLQSDQAESLTVTAQALQPGPDTSTISLSKESAGKPRRKVEQQKDVARLEEMENLYDISTPPQSPSIQLTPPLASLAQGTPVLALWQFDKHFYPGHIICREKGDRYTVMFEDGNKRQVKESDMIVVDLLEPGSCVFAVLQEDWIQPAVVLDTWRTADEKGYLLEFPDNTQKKLLRSEVYLSYGQAAGLLVPSTCPAPSQIVAARANVSLDNLVEGKRQRGSAKKGDTSHSVPKEEEENGGTPKKKSATGAKRKLVDITPKATSTPTPKTKRRMLMAQDAGDAPSPLYDSPQGSKKTPRKSKHELFSEVKGPIPSTGSHLFLGMAFLLTHVDRTEEQKRQERNIVRQESLEASTTDYSTSEEDVAIPFDKDHLRLQIEHGGGLVLDKFDLDMVGTADQCLLVSDTYQRTVKYFHCLAAGIPCVSHVWIRDCCVQNGQHRPLTELFKQVLFDEFVDVIFQETILDFKAYMLPAGISLEKNKIMEWSSRGSVLKGRALMVSSENRHFCDLWVKVLETCGCYIVHKLPTIRSSEQVDFLVADKAISQSHLQRAWQLQIPVVSSEWVIQCLINSRVMDTEGHPKYRYDFDGE